MELGIVIALVALVCLPLATGTPGGLRLGLSAALLTVAALAAVALRGQTTARQAMAARRTTELPQVTGDGGYVSSDACRACHPEQYSTWHDTYHRTMTQPASPDTVVAPFEGVTLDAHDGRYALSRDGDRFWVDAGAANGGRREVVMVTGSHHQQRYWLRGEGGNSLDLLPFAWLIAERRWVPGDAIFLMPPERQSGIAPRLWNANCVACHSVVGQPGAPSPRDVPGTRVAELGIACEACHGPGAEHVRLNADPTRRYRLHLATDGDPSIVNPSRLPADRASQICGQCHAVARFKDMAHWRAHGPGFRPDRPLDEDRWVIRYEANPVERWKSAAPPGLPPYMEQHFWRDGTIRISGREYTGLIESACAQRGTLSCLSCHGMHGTDPNDQLKPDKRDDAACSPCHDDVRAAGTAHTRHATGSAGSRCVNCHMPRTTLGLLTAMRSHRIDRPSVAVSLETGRPNACNLCHLDRTLGWTAEQLTAGWGVPAVAVPEEEQRVAAGVLWLLRGDAGQRELMAWHMGWAPAREASGTTWMAPFLAQLLDDPYAAVRFNAGRSIASVPGVAATDYDYVAPAAARAAIRDRVRAALPPPDRTGPALLLRDDGALDRQAAADLLARRDDRVVNLAE